MKVIQGYKTELDPTSEPYALLCQCAGSARFAYNYGLARKQEAYKNGEKTPSAVQLQKELTARKHDDLPWLGEESKQNKVTEGKLGFKTGADFLLWSNDEMIANREHLVKHLMKMLTDNVLHTQ